MKTEHKALGYYLTLPYTKTLRRDEDGDIVARVMELPGCSAHGETEHEALQNLEEAMRLWLEDCIGANDPVPEPEAQEPLPSGKWVQRVPRTLHRKLVQAARQEGVSLNQLVTSMLSERLSHMATQKQFEEMFTNYLLNWRRAPVRHRWDTNLASDAWFVDSDPPEPSSNRMIWSRLLPRFGEVKINHAIESKNYTTCER